MNNFEKIKHVFKNPSWIIVMLNNRGLHCLNDAEHIKLLYRLRMGKELDLDNPQTFNEKLQWLKLHDRTDIYTTMVDKYEVKQYVAGIIGEEYIIPTLGVYDSFDSINFSDLPNQFVIKCTHDSGGLVICKDKSTFDKRAARKKINRCLKKNFYWSSREWPYKGVRARIIIEEYMEDKDARELIDYKVMCFHGEAKMIFTCTERFSGDLKVTFFDLDWNKLPFTRHHPSSSKTIKKPKNLRKMIALSEKMSSGIPFVRMDWYEINGKLFFGEYTFYPGSGFEEFDPESWDKKIGDWIELPKKEIV